MIREDVGIVILGSQDERHGLLPKDTDTKIATYVAFKAASLTGAKLVGIVNSAAEHEYIRHGRHHTPAIVLLDIKRIIENSRERLGIKKFIIVNGHGGNKLVLKHLPEIEGALAVDIAFNNKLIELEGAHAATEECSMAVAAGLVSPKGLRGQGDFERFPEVGFVGMKEAHVDKVLKRLALKTEKEGVKVDVNLGLKLLEKAVSSLVDSIKEM